VPPVKVPDANARIDAAAIAAGRSPSDIRRIYNVGGDIVPTNTKADEIDHEVTGPPAHWVEVLTHFAVDLGFGSFILWGEPEERRLRTFIKEIAPAVRERVAAHRAGGARS
jgi:hypothetical protein